MKDKFNEFMNGRYGADDLSRFMMGSSVVLMLLNLLLRIRILNTVVIVLIVLIYVRMFSKNIQKRYQENLKYLELRNRIIGPLRSGKGISGMADDLRRKAEDRKVNHIYKCPSCGQKIRIPRGKGTIIVTCPKCKTEFRKKS